MPKELHAATDFNDEIHGSRRLWEQGHIDSLMRSVAALGVKRLDWIIYQSGLMERGYPGGFDLLACAVDRAHAHGLKTFAVFKPFEGGRGFGLPDSFPRIEGVPLLEDIRGPMPVVDPFVAAHPQLRFQRREGGADPGGHVAKIRLIKQDASPTRIGSEHLSIWTGSKNNQYNQYERPFTLRESIERRPLAQDHETRVLSLEGLNIPADQRYIVVRCALADSQGDFTNSHGELVELINDREERIPSTPGMPPTTDRSGHRRRFSVWGLMNPYFRRPEVRREVEDAARLQAHFRDFYSYDANIYSNSLDAREPYTLDERGVAAVARGKAEYLPGALHPIYPQVQEYWLGWVDFCIERGVDGMDFRVGNHSDRSHEREQYGFNAPVMETSGGPDRAAAARAARAAGDAYTAFLANARDRLKAKGRQISVQLARPMLDGVELGGEIMPPNVEWQWERWVREIADSVVLRLRHPPPQPQRDGLVDRVSRVAKEAGVPLIYQSTRNISQVRSNEPTDGLEREMDFAASDPRVDAYQLYETATFARLGEEGTVRCVAGLPSLLAGRFGTR